MVVGPVASAVFAAFILAEFLLVIFDAVKAVQIVKEEPIRIVRVPLCYLHLISANDGRGICVVVYTTAFHFAEYHLLFVIVVVIKRTHTATADKRSF